MNTALKFFPLISLVEPDLSNSLLNSPITYSMLFRLGFRYLFLFCKRPFHFPKALSPLRGKTIEQPNHKPKYDQRYKAINEK